MWVLSAAGGEAEKYETHFILLSDITGVRPQRQGDRGECEHFSQR